MVIGTKATKTTKKLVKVHKEKIVYKITSVLKMSQKIIEFHQIVTVEHHLKTNGHTLIEKKQKTIITPMVAKDERIPETIILVHIRSLDGKSCKVTETMIDGVEEGERTTETDLTDSELEILHENWRRFWSPQLAHNLH